MQSHACEATSTTPATVEYYATTTSDVALAVIMEHTSVTQPGINSIVSVLNQTYGNCVHYNSVSKTPAISAVTPGSSVSAPLPRSTETTQSSFIATVTPISGNSDGDSNKSNTIQLGVGIGVGLGVGLPIIILTWLLYIHTIRDRKHRRPGLLASGSDVSNSLGS